MRTEEAVMVMSYSWDPMTSVFEIEDLSWGHFASKGDI